MFSLDEKGIEREGFGSAFRRGQPVKEIVAPSGKCKVVILLSADGIYRLEVHVEDYEELTQEHFWYHYDAGSFADTVEKVEELAWEEIRCHTR